MVRRKDYLVRFASQHLDGCNWYRDAERSIRYVAKANGWNVERFAGVLSAFSPRVSVTRNIRFAMRYMTDGKFEPDVMRSVRTSVQRFESDGYLRGIKTEPFRKALLGDTSAIVLDVHMADLFGIEQRSLRRRNVTLACERAIGRCAKSIDLSDRDCQAVLWYAQKRSKNQYPTEFNIERVSV